MSLDLGPAFEAEPAPPREAGASRTDPGAALRAALTSGARRIHLDVSERGVRLRSRIAGRLSEVAFLPGDRGRSLVALLEDAARDGIGTLELDGGERCIRYRLAGCGTAECRSFVLTLLPSVDESPADNLRALDAPAEMQTALARDLEGGRGLILVAGPPRSGRSRTLRALAGEADADAVLLLSFDDTPPVRAEQFPVMKLDLREQIWSLLHAVESMDVDRFVLPEIRTPLQATLALALSGERRLGVAPIGAQDSTGALVKMRELAADRYRAARDLLAVIAQHRLPRPCPKCSTLRPLRPEELRESCWDPAALRKVLARVPEIRVHGEGCEACAGSGYAGWTYIYEYQSVTGEAAELLRRTSDPGRLREELKALTAGGGLMDAAWRELLRGNIEPEELERIPGPEVVAFRPRASWSSEPTTRARNDEGDVPTATPPVVVPTRDPSSPTSLDSVDHDLYRAGYDVLRPAVAAVGAGDPVNLGELEDLAERIVAAVEGEPELVQIALTGGSGDNLLVHQLNVAVLSVRVGLALQWSRGDLARMALAALLHDVGLIRVPIQVIQKEKKLTKKQETIRRRHAEWGEQMVREALPEQGWLPAVIRQVHERDSGRGYPDGLTGEAIDPLAKVIGLADCVEALTHPRPGRPAMIAFDAIQFLMKEWREDFDPGIFRAMVREFSLFPVGSRVLLNNGSVARVASINADNLYRPKVEIVFDASGKEITGGRVVDLKDSPFLYITAPCRENVTGGSGKSSRR